MQFGDAFTEILVPENWSQNLGGQYLLETAENPRKRNLKTRSLIKKKKKKNLVLGAGGGIIRDFEEKNLLLVYV